MRARRRQGAAGAHTARGLWPRGRRRRRERPVWAAVRRSARPPSPLGAAPVLPPCVPSPNWPAFTRVFGPNVSCVTLPLPTRAAVDRGPPTPAPPNPPRPAPALGELVEDLEKLLLSHPEEVGELFAIPRARIPVIKLVWRPTGTKVGGGGRGSGSLSARGRGPRRVRCRLRAAGRASLERTGGEVTAKAARTPAPAGSKPGESWTSHETG